ncbi:uncharacterized protein [Cicer arietinum]|uniref:Uncharacterized protein LOC101498868 n=1 Tax=Cicer arietinum TaxID=3827 RepID=A0A1S2X9I1_CICAR|nr:uncharacterized protein LOC101498868 [Cicer arietinum]
MMQMQTLGSLCLFVFLHHHSVLSLYHKFLRFSLRFVLFMDLPSTFNFLTQASELGCGFVLLGYFSRLFNFVGLVLIFGICLKILRFSDTPIFWNPTKVHNLDTQLKSPAKCDDGVVASEEKERDENLEDEVFDVMSLRNLVKMERQRYHAACAEIEKERLAASTAAEEAMAMILRLQNEKSSVEIQANQFRRMVEERQEYDQEVIESLRWNVVQHESQKSFLEEQLGIYKEKLREFMNDDEIELLEGADFTREFCNFSVEYDDAS